MTAQNKPVSFGISPTHFLPTVRGAAYPSNGLSTVVTKGHAPPYHKPSILWRTVGLFFTRYFPLVNIFDRSGAFCRIYIVNYEDTPGNLFSSLFLISAPVAALGL